MSSEYVGWSLDKEGKGNEQMNMPVILGLEIPSTLPSHSARRHGREKAQRPGGLPLVLLEDLPGEIRMVQDLPGKVHEKEETLLPAACSQKRFWTEPWSAQKSKYPHTEKAHVLYFLT